MHTYIYTHAHVHVHKPIKIDAHDSINDKQDLTLSASRTTLFVVGHMPPTERAECNEEGGRARVLEKEIVYVK